MRTFDHEMASHDPSEIPFAGLAVDVIEFYGGLLYLHAHGDPGHLRLQISGEFGLSGPGVEDAAVLDTEHGWPSLAAVLSLQYLSIRGLQIDDDRVLRMQLGDDWSITVGPDPESWSLNGPGDVFRAAYL